MSAQASQSFSFSHTVTWRDAATSERTTARVAPSPLHNTARLYSTQFRCFSITTEFYREATVTSYCSFFSPLVSSKLTRVPRDYGPQRGFPHSSHLTCVRMTTVSQIMWVLQSVISLILKTFDFVLKKYFPVCCIFRFCVYFETESWWRQWLQRPRRSTHTLSNAPSYFIHKTRGLWQFWTAV